jgi:hypothetical protein
VCGLRWEWEVPVPELGTSVFLIPGSRIKNGEERLVVLNRVAQSVVEACRGLHPEFVFPYRGKRIETMHNSAWRNARSRAGLPHVRVHDLKHTFGRRLRAAGVSFEDRQDLLGHKSGRVTTHYSAAEPQNLLDATERECEDDSRKTPTLVVLKQRAAGAQGSNHLMGQTNSGAPGRMNPDTGLKRCQSPEPRLAALTSGVDPISWTPDPYPRRSPQCPRPARRTPPHSANR